MCLYQSKYTVKVSFEDLDPMNVVWHGNYMRYMEQARCNMLEELKYTYMDMKKEDYAYPVAKMNVKYIKPAAFGDVLTVVTKIEELEPALNMKYEIFKDKEKIFEAKTMQIGVNVKTLESVYAAPKGLKKAIERALNA